MNDASQQLSQLLSTEVLESVATLNEQAILQGQVLPGRMSSRTHFPRVNFYGETQMSCGLLGHAHPHGELAVVTRGNLNVGIGEYLYEAKQGDWLVFTPDMIHGECCLTSHRSYELLWIIFQSRKRRALHLTKYHRQNGYQMLANTSFDSLSDTVSDHNKILLLNPWEDLQQIRICLVRELSELLDQLSKVKSKATSPMHPMILQVQQILARHTGKFPTVVQLANEVGLSPNYLSNLFRQEMSTRLVHYMNQVRVDRAKQLLASPSSSIKNVAYQLNFTDPYHFSRVFRRVTGTSPTSYRTSIATKS